MTDETTSTAKTEMTVELGNSEYGTPAPRVRVRFSAGPSYRQCRAAMLRLAAAVEEHSGDARWVVTIGDVFIAGRGRKEACVELELSGGSEREAEVGLEVLRQAVKEVA